MLGDINSLGVAGDGAPIVTSVYPRSKSTCDCRAQGITNCKHSRIYSQPDCNSGWDSSRGKYFNGYHLYMLSTTDSHYDLPLYPRLQPASRHDAVSLVVSSCEFKQHFTLGTVDRMLLDAAHDAESIYHLLETQKTEPFIDLNDRSKKSTPTNSDISISPRGILICSCNLEVKLNGKDSIQHSQKWRCPKSTGTKNSCATPCSKAKYVGLCPKDYRSHIL